MNCWLDEKGKCVKTQPLNCYGFVYLITNLNNGRIYVGKKAFMYKKKTRLSKKAKKATGKRIKVEQVDSQWLNYFGSSIDLKADVSLLGPSSFKREILHICKNKAQMSYLEAKEQFARGVLEMGDKSYNKWIGIKSFKSQYIIA